MENKGINIRYIMDKLTQHPLMADMSLDSAVYYTVELIRIMGMPKLLTDKTEEIETKEYRAELPCDYEYMIQVKDTDTDRCMRHTTDSFHLSPDNVDSKEPTYKIQGRVMFTSEKSMKLLISYGAVEVDDEGFPLLIDDAVFLRTLESYIKLRWFTILFDTGKISSQILSNTQSEYAFNAAQCHNRFLLPSVDEMESICNIWTTSIQRVNEHSNGFKNLGTKERIKLH